MTTGVDLDFAGARFTARPSGALWWPGRRTLVVADLHLGRAERQARRGGALLPPYEVAETLERLRHEVEALAPVRVLSLGDAFDDDTAAGQLEAGAVAALHRLARGREWLWISGNHDPAPAGGHLPGESVAFWQEGPDFRHQAGEGPDVSGHLHPVIRLAGARRRCFVKGARHLLLPAFGTYTGGLEVSHPAIARLTEGGIAIVCGRRAFAVPLEAPARGGAVPPRAGPVR